jgi:S1-C subfamily serine protease
MVQMPGALALTMGMGAPRGLFAVAVTPGGVAYRVGIRRGDVILSFAETAVDRPDELQSLVAQAVQERREPALKLLGPLQHATCPGRFSITDPLGITQNAAWEA